MESVVETLLPTSPYQTNENVNSPTEKRNFELLHDVRNESEETNGESTNLTNGIDDENEEQIDTKPPEEKNIDLSHSEIDIEENVIKQELESPEISSKNCEDKTLQCEKENNQDIDEDKLQLNLNSDLLTENSEKNEQQQQEIIVDKEVEKTVTGNNNDLEASLVDSEDEDADDPEPITNEAGDGTAGNEKEREDVEAPHQDSSNSAVEDNTVTDTSESSQSLPNNNPQKSCSKHTPQMSSFRRGYLKNLTKSDLEELVVQKICESITERSTTGELRRRCRALEHQLETWKQRYHANMKHMRDLELVMNKFIDESKKRQGDGVVMPVRITRSVGLQVAFNGTKKTSMNVPNKRPRDEKEPPLATKKARTATNSLKNVESNTPKKSAELQQIRPKRVATLEIKKPKKVVEKPAAVTSTPQPAAVTSTPQQKTGDTSLNKTTVIDIDLTDDEESPIQNGLTKTVTSPNGNKGNEAASNQVVSVLKPPPLVSVFQQQNSANRLGYLVPLAQGKPQFVITGQVPKPPSLVRHCKPAVNAGTSGVTPIRPAPKQHTHPAPLPPTPVYNNNPFWKPVPPRPILKISKINAGIVLSWDIAAPLSNYEEVSSYQLVAYQEGISPPNSSLWKKVGEVKALPLPMACTLTQFIAGFRYHFSVRAVDVHSRAGNFSLPGTILLMK